MALSFLKRPRWFLASTPVLQYTEQSKHDKPGDPTKPMGHNLGYWRTARTHAEACADLARYLARAARLEPRDEVLDVGCGCAEQDVLWAREFKPKKIAGLDITPARVELAAAHIASAGVQDRVEVRLGSATELPFADCSFDKVVALESAFHFKTRERFFGEAYRVLRPGGRLAVADMVPSPTRRRSWVRQLALRFSRRAVSIPDANVYDRLQYAMKLAERGFVDINVDSIGDYVFPGASRAKDLQLEGRERIAVDLQPEDFVAEDWLCSWRDMVGFDEYVVVTADKPPTA
jgi:microcystin synthetase protein McyJ